MNNRVAKLREQSIETQPWLSLERARLMTEAYKLYKGTVSTPVLRALSFKYLLENKTICINKGELIVGERSQSPRATPTYPELCCHTIDDFEIIIQRDKISYEVNEEAKKSQHDEIIPYWKGKSIRNHILNQMSEEWMDCFEAGIFTEFMEQRAPGHTVADGKIFEKGFLDFKEEIESHLSELNYFDDSASFEKQEELQAMVISVNAIISFAERYAEKAEALAESESDQTRKQELLQIAGVCRRVPARKPRNLHEALQMYWFVHLGVIIELNTWDSFNIGRIDQHLYPFYKNDIELDILDREKAKELLQCFWIKFNNQPAPPKVGVTAQESGTYTDFANINVGGLKQDGSDGVNEFSYLVLDVIDEMRLLQPSSNVQISKKTPDRFLKRALKIIRKGWGQPSVFNSDEVVCAMLRRGKNIEDARSGGTSGCVETGAFGKESYILTGYFNLVKVLEITLNNGIDPNSGKKIGIETGKPVDFNNFDELMTAYEKQIDYFIDIKIKGNNIIEKIYAEYMPSPFLSVIIDDCIKKGRDYNSGGARYNTNYIQGVGMGNITDSLASLKHNIFDHNNFTMQELLNELHNNFKNSEHIYNSVKHNSPKYGNDNEYADDLLVTIANKFYNSIDGRKNMKGGSYGINFLPTTSHIYFGSVIGATPDGRVAGKPLSEGTSPVQGADQHGPTAVIKSVSKLDHVKTGGTLLNQKFTPELLSGDEGIDHLLHLIRAYFKLDGHHIQFNVVDDEILKEAQKNPEEYQNLIVRVAGYSDYFNNLTKELQDEIIERNRHHYFA